MTTPSASHRIGAILSLYSGLAVSIGCSAARRSVGVTPNPADSVQLYAADSLVLLPTALRVAMPQVCAANHRVGDTLTASVWRPKYRAPLPRPYFLLGDQELPDTTMPMLFGTVSITAIDTAQRVMNFRLTRVAWNGLAAGIESGTLRSDVESFNSSGLTNNICYRARGQLETDVQPRIVLRRASALMHRGGEPFP